MDDKDIVVGVNKAAGCLGDRNEKFKCIFIIPYQNLYKKIRKKKLMENGEYIGKMRQKLFKEISYCEHFLYFGYIFLFIT